MQASGESLPIPSLTGIRPQRAVVANRLSAVLEHQRTAFLHDRRPSLKQLRADLAKAGG
jgi:hypothetical protein